MFLLDTGLIFSALVEGHSSHKRVDQWLSAVDRFATCGLTQIGAFRLLIMEAAMRERPLKADNAHQLIENFTKHEKHFFVECPPISKTFVGQTVGHKAAFDDYLVQIAFDAGCTLATLDQPLSRRWPDHTNLIAQSS